MSRSAENSASPKRQNRNNYPRHVKYNRIDWSRVHAKAKQILEEKQNRIQKMKQAFEERKEKTKKLKEQLQMLNEESKRIQSSEKASAHSKEKEKAVNQS